MPTTMSTLMWRDFLGTQVQPGLSRQSPENRMMLHCADDNKRRVSEKSRNAQFSQIYLHIPLF